MGDARPIRRARAAALAGGLLAAGYTLQTLGLERTSVSSAGFVTGMYVVLTPLLALRLLPDPGRSSSPGSASRSRRSGLALLAGVHGGSGIGDLLVLGGAAVYSLQIVLMERYAPRYDAARFHARRDARRVRRPGASLAVPTDVRAARLDGVGRTARDGHLRERARVSRPDLGPATARARPGRRSSSRSSPSGRRSSACTLAGDRLGAVGWAGCAVIMVGIVLAEPDAADVLRRLVRGPRAA